MRMKKTKVVDRRNLPMNPPTLLTVVACLVCDRLNITGVAWGVVLTLLGIDWFVFFYFMFHDEPTKIFSEMEER